MAQCFELDSGQVPTNMQQCVMTEAARDIVSVRVILYTLALSLLVVAHQIARQCHFGPGLPYGS